MSKAGSDGLEHPNSNTDSIVQVQRNAVHEMDAREKMVAARREQQRLHILRNSRH